MLLCVRSRISTFEGVLFDRIGSAWRVRDALPLLSRLGREHRLGLLCNLPPRYDAAAFRLLLRDHGFEAWFESGTHPCSPLCCPRRCPIAARSLWLPRWRKPKPETLTYITANPKLSAAAEESGWHTAPPSAPAATVLLSVDAGTGAPAPAGLHR